MAMIGLRCMWTFLGEDPTVDGEIVKKMLPGSEEIEDRLVHFAVRGRKEVIKCNATFVKSIEW